MFLGQQFGSICCSRKIDQHVIFGCGQALTGTGPLLSTFIYTVGCSFGALPSEFGCLVLICQWGLQALSHSITHGLAQPWSLTAPADDI